MDFSIRPALAEDYEGLCQVFAEVDALHREALPHVFRAADGPARSREYISGLLADENAALFVAESVGEITGFVFAFLRQAPDTPLHVPRRYAMIDTLAVKEKCRRAGLGRALMERAEQWGRDHGASEVDLSVWEFNQEAIAFYERLGYETTLRRMARPLT